MVRSIYSGTLSASGLTLAGTVLVQLGRHVLMGCPYIECEGYAITLCKEQKEHPGIGSSSSLCFRFQQIPSPSIFHQPVCGER